MVFQKDLSRINYDQSKEEGRFDVRHFSWCFISAVLIMTICTRSSLLYVYNLWDDANSYFTVGKCIFRGFVPYRDLFDQKGIMLYFIYGIASLVSSTTFLGVFFMEIIAASFSLAAIFKLFQLFTDSDIAACVLTPISGAIIYSSIDFYWGGSAEEFLFPFIMWGLYISARHFRKSYPEAMPYKTVLIGGLFAGCVLNIKFNSLGFYFAWMAVVFFADIIGSRQIGKALISCFVFLGGMGLSTLPWIIYFGINGAISDWLYVYIYKNVFEYSKKITLSERVYLIYDILKNHALNNPVVFAIVFVGIVYFAIAAITTLIRGKKKDSLILDVTVSELINLGMLFFFLVLVIFIGGVSLPYYIFPMNGFAIFGLIPVGLVLKKLDAKKAVAVLGVFSMIASFCICWFLSVNVKSMDLKEEDLYLFKFRDYILASGVEDPGVIVEFTFDVGLYTVLDVNPICYYFQTQTLNMQEVINYQKQYLHSGEADFVVTKDIEAEGTGERYDLVMEDHCVFYNYDHTYYLYQRNDTPAQ